MTDDAKTFKRIVQDLLNKSATHGSISDTTIDEEIARTFAAREVLRLDISEEEKTLVRNELLAENRIRLDPGVALVPLSHKKWFVERKSELSLDYWNRFKEHLIKDKGFPVNVVSEMDNVSDEIVDLLGDPTRVNAPEQRRGLIIGDVQSGKTVNYSGIICKAVDAGFRIVILMTGTTNDLRKQTQMRLDEAFLGIPTDASGKQDSLRFIGAGKYNRNLRPMAFTSVQSDFSISAVRQMTTALSQDVNDKPMLFVIKKNVSVLNNLLKWMTSFNQYDTSKAINNSILMIDDEADYASVNTKAEGEDPARTNYLIEQILNVFRFSSYVGFTATPYANVFIDPESDKQMQREGLFPKDYIYSLSAPSNYIGARDIFRKNARYRHILRDIDDGEDYYPLRHKKTDDFSTISNTLREAIHAFVLANAISDLRGNKTSHRTMMINVTRFVDTQKSLRKAVSDYLDDIVISIRTYAARSSEIALQDKHLKSLSETFEREYKNCDFTWEELQSTLFSTVESMQVMAAHGGGDDLNYHEYEDGLRVIVVGGMRLSRGLTLEGLIVSYIYRNSMAYDTLMQMGRWFGYRPGYDDICRIWMDKISQNWYGYISEATDELRDEVRRMRDLEATPLDFGLKVRSDNDIPLIITARNKMRTAASTTLRVSLSTEHIETPYLYNNPEKNNQINFSSVVELIESNNFENFGSKIGALNISKDKILNFLSTITVPPANTRFDPRLVASFIKQYGGRELDSWDVVILSGDGEEFRLNDKFSVKPNKRQVKIRNNNGLIVMNQRRLGSPNDTSFGLTQEQVEEVDAKVLQAGRTLKSRNSKDYLLVERRPLLMVYFIQPEVVEGADNFENFEKFPLIAFAVGIPSLSNATTKYISYRINKIHQEFGGIEEFEDE